MPTRLLWLTGTARLTRWGSTCGAFEYGSSPEPNRSATHTHKQANRQADRWHIDAHVVLSLSLRG